VDTDNRENANETDGVLSDANKRCIELTKGFDRACREPVSKTIVEHYWILLFLIFFVMVFSEPKSLGREFWIICLFIFAFEILPFWQISQVITISRLFQNLNKIHYQMSSFLESLILKSEKLLLILFVTKESPFSFRLKSGVTGGVLVLTTHRGFLITASNIYLRRFDNLLNKPSVLLTELFDYSSPIGLLQTYDPKNIFDRTICKRYAIKTANSDKPETWYVMPTEGNNYALLEAILEKRDRIK
jgi:hypothetical protein